MILGTNKKIFSDSVILANPAQLFSTTNINIYLRDNACQGLSDRYVSRLAFSLITRPPLRTHDARTVLPSLDPAVSDDNKKSASNDGYRVTSRYIDIIIMAVIRVIHFVYFLSSVLFNHAYFFPFIYSFAIWLSRDNNNKKKKRN